eukprot:TRINITY_DN13434_c0_g1_i1.p1 TRINITY_DN13434_c0_g1~~TRINITY_DN13434_c0_g1_i1.p1  ORF type:complete len:256 (+),score=21.65 TRINITY_DN13434_c0_g1_i1:54-821(+)
MKTPISWFKTTPNVQIIQRCTKDQDDVDGNLPLFIQTALTNILQALLVIIMISTITPLFSVFAIIIFYYYVSIFRYYLKTAREIKRVSSSLVAQVSTHVGETYNGLYMLRATRKLYLFCREYHTKSDTEHRGRVNDNYSERWMSLRTDFIGALVVSGVAFLAVITKLPQKSIDPADLGLSLTWGLSFIAGLSFSIRNAADTEVQMDSVQRIIEYTEQNPKEKDNDGSNPPQDWPKTGKVEVKNLYIRYRPDLPTV